jgi:hypothetical protein
MPKSILTAALLTFLLGLFALGCGGGSSSSNSSADTSTADTTTEATTKPTTVEAPPFSESELAAYGKEATAAERKAASDALQKNLFAREAKQWAAQCATLTAAVVKVIEKESEFLHPFHPCPEGLKAQAGSAPAVLFKDTLSGEIDALRLQGGEAMAIYHGNDGKDWAMPMKKEGGEWKVGSLTTILIGTTKKPEAENPSSGAPSSDAKS